MPYRAIITIVIPAFLIYATLSVSSPARVYAENEPITHFEPEKIEPPANETVQPEEKKGISKCWYVLIAVVLAGGAAAAAGGGGSKSSGGAAAGGGGGGTVGVSW